MRARLDPNRGTQWPDMIGDGHLVWLFIISGRFVDALRAERIRVELGGRIGFTGPVPKRLSLADAPDYHWLDPERHRAARMDCAASGIVGVERCVSCGRQSYVIKASSDESPPVFEYDASLGLDLFTTDMGKRFYSTERVLECARKYRLMNVAFWPVEEGPLAKLGEVLEVGVTTGIGNAWPPHCHPERLAPRYRKFWYPSDGAANAGPLAIRKARCAGKTRRGRACPRQTAFNCLILTTFCRVCLPQVTRFVTG